MSEDKKPCPVSKEAFREAASISAEDGAKAFISYANGLAKSELTRVEKIRNAEKTIDHPTKRELASISLVRQTMNFDRF